VRGWVEWAKHSLHISTAPLPPSLSSEAQNPKNFLFLLKEKGGAKFLKKCRKIFWEFETSLWLVRKQSGN